MNKTVTTSLALLKDRRCLEMIFPISIIFASLWNLFLFYIGLAYVDNIGRAVLFIAGGVLFAGMCGVMFLQTLREVSPSRSCWILGGAMLAFFGCCFLGAFIRFGLADYVVDYTSHFVFFSLPAFLCGTVAALRRTEKSFFTAFEKLTFLVLPAAVIYFNLIVFSCTPFEYNNYLGIYDYMIVYAFMPFLMAHIIGFAEGREFPNPFGTKGTFRHPQLLRAVLVFIYWYDIIGSGTRGAHVSVLLFAVLLVVFQRIYRRPVKRAAAALAFLIGVFLFCLLVYAPPTMEEGLSRWKMFLFGLQEGKIVTSERDAFNRGTLYRQAWELFCDSPILGIGTCAYWAKYDIYPHCSVLELLCETGLVGTIPFLALVIYAVVKLFRIGKENISMIHFLVFMSAYAFFSVTSDTIWNCPPLYGALGLALAMPGGKKTGGRGKKA